MGGNQIPGVGPQPVRPSQTVETWVAQKIINHYIPKMNGSWATKLTGITSLLTLWGNTLVMLTDNNPSTNPDWSLVISGTLAAIGVVFARQNNKTSEDVGLKQLR